MAAFVGANRKRALDAFERGIVGGGQRLLDQRDAQPRELGREGLVLRERPAFVGVDDEFGVRRAGAHRLDALKIAVGTELDLEQRPVGVLRRFLAHRCRRAERNRVGGRRGPRLGEAREPPDRRRRPFRFEVPEGAVERVARGPGRQPVLQRDAIESVVEVDRDGTDERHHALRRLAVARIGNAFAAPQKPSVGQRRRYDADFRARPARDREGAGDGKTLFNDAEPNRHHNASNAAAERRPPPLRRLTDSRIAIRNLLVPKCLICARSP